MVSYDEAKKQTLEYFNGNELATEVFISKYAIKNREGVLQETTPKDMHRRIAKELARIEAKYPNPLSEEEIFSYLDQFSSLIPQGSPMTNIGNPYQVSSISNCFTLPQPVDSYGGILHTDQQQVQIMKRRGGVGFDISTLRPKGQPTANSANTTDGIEIFLKRYSNSCREAGQRGRRGALILLLSIMHPQIRDFINIKRNKKDVTGANISIRFTDKFMKAVKQNKEFVLRFPCDESKPAIITEVVKAKEIWDAFIDASWESAEPGALFWDTILKRTPSDIYKNFGFETIGCNPCGELILGAFGACNLFVINLFFFVKNPFTKDAYFDFESFGKYAQIAQKLADDLVDLEIEADDKIIEKIKIDPESDDVKKIEFDLWNKIKETNTKGRRTGLGPTALGDTIAALGVRFGKDSVEITENIYKTLAKNSYISSIQMAKDRGAFPICDVSLEKNHVFIKQIIDELPKEYQELYLKVGRRNIANTTTAPAGSTSLLAKLSDGYFGTTSGIEPAFKLSYKRRKKINQNDINSKIDFTDAMGDKWEEFEIKHSGYALWMDIKQKEFDAQPIEQKLYCELKPENSPYWKSTANDIDWKSSILVQAIAQKWTCHSISKTVNLPSWATKELITEVFITAYESGFKGLTVYRDGCRDGVLISNEDAKKQQNTNPDLAKQNAARRPKELPCEVIQATVLKEKWTIFVGLLEDKPYEIMAGLSSSILLPKRVKTGKIIKHNGTEYPTAKYDFVYDFDKGPDDVTTLCDIIKLFNNQTHAAITRILSLSLRHGVPLEYIVEQLEKSADRNDENIFAFSRVMARTLNKYAPDRKLKKEECPECKQKGTLVYSEGCVHCAACSFSRCG